MRKHIADTSAVVNNYKRNFRLLNGFTKRENRIMLGFFHALQLIIFLVNTICTINDNFPHGFHPWFQTLFLKPVCAYFRLAYVTLWTSLCACFLSVRRTMFIFICITQDTSYMWLLVWLQGFPKIWPGDLLFWHTWPRFEIGLHIVKIYILTKVHQTWDICNAFIVITWCF